MNWMIRRLDTLDSPEAKLWCKVLATVQENFDTRARLQRTLHSLVEQELLFLDNASENVYSPWIVRIPYKSLSQFGRPDDIGAPLGFLKASLPFEQPDPDALRIYAPCILTTLERLSYGPELIAAYNANRKPNCSNRDLLLAAKTRLADNRPLLAFIGQARDKITALKARFAPFYSLSTAQHFYEEGVRFYFHPQAKRFYVGSGSSGLIIPEEHYGEELYFPGITALVPPGQLSSPEGVAAEAWRFLVRKVLVSGERISNPMRTLYFDRGLQRAVGEVTYSIYWPETLAALAGKWRTWRDRGLQDEYISDVVALLRHYLENKAIRVMLLYDDFSTSPHFTRTLVSHGYLFLSARPEAKKIKRGTVINLPLTKRLLVGGATATVSLLRALLGSLHGASIPDVVGAKSSLIDWFLHREEKRIQHQTGKGIVLRDQVERNYGKVDDRNLRRWISDELSKFTPITTGDGQ